jgi:uroporphyrinogen decarboxylase
MLHPMEKFDSVEQILSYPFPDYSRSSTGLQAAKVKEAHDMGVAAMGSMSIVVWEGSWYLRGKENLMIDMMSDDPMAEALLDKMTSIAIYRAESFVRSGVDILLLGDDIGMQHSVMMSEELYCTWLKPRFKRVIDAARAINPGIIVFYHSCGYVKPFIPHLIEAGIDVLNPVQPECMKFSDIHKEFGERLSFHGTIGTQSTMPFGTPDDVRREVFTNLDIAGDKGGLYVCPTHLLEPEVPVENVVAYLKACKDYK